MNGSAQAAAYGTWHELDAASRKILWTLARRRHLSLAALGHLVGRSEMDTLLHLRQVIQPWVSRHLRPGTVAFRERHVDPPTGELVTYEWWFDGWPAGSTTPTACDVVVEEEALAIVAAIPTEIRLAATAGVDVLNGILEVRIARIAPDTAEEGGDGT